MVEADEQEPERERERLQRADRGRLGAEAAPRARRAAASASAPSPQKPKYPSASGTPASAGRGRAGERDHRERVPGERLPAQHHEPAGDAGHDGDDRPRLERVHHERVREELLHVVDRVPRQPGEDGGQAWACRSPCTNGASGCPTTTSRPSEARSTSIGTPYSAAERLARDHLLRRALDGGAAGEVDDAVEVADDRVDVVRDEQDGDVLLVGRCGARARRRPPGWAGRGCRAARRAGAAAAAATSACAMSSRCCSPPESSPIGLRAYAVAPTSSITSCDARSRRAARAARERDAPARAVEAEPDEVDAADARAARRSSAAAAGSRSRSLALAGALARARSRARPRAAAGRARP